MSTILSWLNGTTQAAIAPPMVTARRGTCGRRESEKNRPAGPRKKEDYHSPEELMELKTNYSIRCGMSDASNTCVLERKRRMYNGPSALSFSNTSATLRTCELPPVRH